MYRESCGCARGRSGPARRSALGARISVLGLARIRSASSRPGRTGLLQPRASASAGDIPRFIPHTGADTRDPDAGERSAVCGERTGSRETPDTRLATSAVASRTHISLDDSSTTCIIWGLGLTTASATRVLYSCTLHATNKPRKHKLSPAAPGPPPACPQPANPKGQSPPQFPIQFPQSHPVPTTHGTPSPDR